MFPKFTKKGIWFIHNKDYICYNWFWNRSAGNNYYSQKFSINFPSLKAYEKYADHIGYSGPEADIKSKNIFGLNYEDIIREWVQLNFGSECIVILTDIDVSQKSMDFWDSIPYVKKVVFTKEVVVLKCKDFSQVEQIVNSVERKFASAFGFKAGTLVYTNDY